MSTSLQIQLPGSLKGWLEREVNARGYSSAGDLSAKCYGPSKRHGSGVP